MDQAHRVAQGYLSITMIMMRLTSEHLQSVDRGNENDFNAGIGTFIRLDDQTGTSSDSTFPAYTSFDRCRSRCINNDVLLVRLMLIFRKTTLM
ncbi:MAG: hypothetical protein IPP46_14345 [Bacteroidetes bacterium]|nr:hypothetical protein [Bacteroidota bacterium]